MALFINVVQTLIYIYEIIIFVWCIFSWIPARDGSWIADLKSVINSLVEPYMSLFRRFIPPVAGIDFSPIVGILVLAFISTILG